MSACPLRSAARVSLDPRHLFETAIALKAAIGTEVVGHSLEATGQDARFSY